MSEKIGQRIRRLRHEHGLTQAALAGERLSESYVSLIESGRRTPTDEVLEYLAQTLGCSVEILKGVDQVSDAAQAEMLIRRAEWETESGQSQAALRHLQQGITLASTLDLPALATRGRAARAKALEMTGQLSQAAAEWETLLAEATSNPRNSWTIPATVALSRCYRELGDLDRAIEIGETFWRNLSDPSFAAPLGHEDKVVVGATLLGAYLELGDRTRSNQLAAQLITLAETADTPKATGAAYWNAALAAQAEGRIAEALRLAERAQASMAQTQDVRNKARLQTALAGLHLRMDPPHIEQALHLLHSAEPVLAQFGSTIDLCYCRTELARAHLQTGDYQQARAIATDLLNQLDNTATLPIESARTLMVLAAANAALQDHTNAHRATLHAAEILEQAGATRQAASSWTELAELCIEVGQTDQAIQAYRKAIELLGTKRTAGITNPATRTLETHQDSQAS